jgi:hypothetical protein
MPGTGIKPVRPIAGPRDFKSPKTLIEINVISATLHEVANTLALIAIINSLEKAVSPEERYILCKSLAELLSNFFGRRQVAGNGQQLYSEQFGDDPRFC